ncbi:MAG: hypothetical protein H0W90_10430 [Actinobacteria bacterium]|nr:hypothetical protein [Actinomycetota bacterium]
MGGVVWTEIPDEDGDGEDTEAHGAVDDTFASRRLRRWLKGMFGGEPAQDEPPGRELES